METCIVFHEPHNTIVHLIKLIINFFLIFIVVPGFRRFLPKSGMGRNASFPLRATAKKQIRCPVYWTYPIFF